MHEHQPRVVFGREQAAQTISWVLRNCKQLIGVLYTEAARPVETSTSIRAGASHLQRIREELKLVLRQLPHFPQQV